MCVDPMYIKRQFHCNTYGEYEPLPTKDGLCVVEDDWIKGWYVPCGKCHECLQRRKNDWFVRTVKELAGCVKRGKYIKNVFMVTLTFDEDHLPTERSEMSAYIRRWKDNIRKKLGYFPKHWLVVERGESEKGTHRLHLHGVLVLREFTHYNVIRNAWKQGYSWIESLKSMKGVSYSIKYCVKGLLERYLQSDQLIGLVFCSKGWGSAWFTENVFWYILGNSKYSYTRVFRVLEAGNYWYAVPRYFIKKTCEFFGVKKYSSMDDWLKQMESPPDSWSRPDIKKKLARNYLVLKQTFNPNLRQFLATA